MPYTYATSSLRRLDNVHSALKQVMLRAKEICPIDFDISCGHRDIAEQNRLYNEGKSQLDGVNHKSKHNYLPAQAVDVYAYNGKYADYDIYKLRLITDAIKEAADYLNVKIDCGIDWTGFVDGPHVELV